MNRSSPLAALPEQPVLTPVALALMAHPDDAEFLCAGTLARLGAQGWRLHVATMTPGDKGADDLGPEEIARVRRAEARAAAALIDAEYHCLEERDLLIHYHPAALEKVVALLRAVRPAVVFTHSPDDYLDDHEQTARLVRAGCFAAPTPNFRAGPAGWGPEENAPAGDRPAAPALGRVPYLYYADAFDGRDALGREIAPEFAVDVTPVWPLKERMLACHESQRRWLARQHGEDPREFLRRRARARGAPVGLDYAEVFRRHRGHAFPADNLLASIL